ncbi:MAG: hypothetical protein KDB00_20475 [Planctomycetales bacterium]|nr:hypothetical protein [Planctomycetales bacterium]
MKFKHFLMASATVVTLSPLAMWSWAEPPVQRIEQSEGMLMRSKLKKSQSVLEGLLRKDFKMIQQGAKEMKLISEAAEWPRARDSVYEHFSTEFRRQCNELEEHAAEQNHKAATFTYLHMTNLCIECHDYVRDSLRVADPTGRNGIQLIPAEWPEGK